MCRAGLTWSPFDLIQSRSRDVEIEKDIWVYIMYTLNMVQVTNKGIFACFRPRCGTLSSLDTARWKIKFISVPRNSNPLFRRHKFTRGSLLVLGRSGSWKAYKSSRVSWTLCTYSQRIPDNIFMILETIKILFTNYHHVTYGIMVFFYYTWFKISINIQIIYFIFRILTNSYSF